jgi:hypothetical protein
VITGLTRIYNYEEQRERADKAIKLNGGTDYDYEPRLLAASSRKPTIRIKPLSFSGPGIKLKGASIQNQLQKEKEKAEKGLKLNGL